jgi:hypothetical protein
MNKCLKLFKLRAFVNPQQAFLLINLLDSIINAFISIFMWIYLQSGSDDIEGHVGQEG